MPRFDLPTGNTWLIRVKEFDQRWDTPWLECGPFRTFCIRICLFGRVLKIARMRTRWL